MKADYALRPIERWIFFMLTLYGRFVELLKSPSIMWVPIFWSSQNVGPYCMSMCLIVAYTTVIPYIYLELPLVARIYKWRIKHPLNFWLPQDKRIHQWSHHISNLAFWEVGKNRKLYGVDDFFKKSLKSIINWMRVHSVLCKHMTFLRPVFHLCLRDFR